MYDKRSEQPAVLDIAVPVYNEERTLDHSVRTLHAYVRNHVPFATRITIVDNASRDATRAIGAELAAALDGVRFVHLTEKGRGRALRAAWMASDARVLAYMDVDLSTRLEALPALIMPIVIGSSDISVGSRLAPVRWSRGVRSVNAYRVATTSCSALSCTRVFAMRSVDSKPYARRLRTPCCPLSVTRAGSSTRSCSCLRNAPACGSAKCPSSGWRTPTRA